MTVKELREREGLSQAEMAGMLRIGGSAYSDKERGRRRFNSNDVVLICRRFSVRAEEVDDFCHEGRETQTVDSNNPRHKRAG